MRKEGWREDGGRGGEERWRREGGRLYSKDFYICTGVEMKRRTRAVQYVIDVWWV